LTFFEPIRIGPLGKSFVDGASGANNPIRELWTEASDVWHQEEPLQDRIQCLISIGTGVPESHAFGKSLLEVARTLKEMALETEKTAEKFAQEHFHLAQNGRYFRFNVTHGLEHVGLEEADKQATIAAATTAYVNTETVSHNLERCVQNLASLVRQGSDVTTPEG
jgi:hypothetical protein